MKLSIISDFHLENLSISYFNFTPPEADTYILAGDISHGTDGANWILRTFPPNKPVIYIAGNHEFYNGIPYNSQLEQLKETFNGTNVHFLENNKIVINGYTFIGATLWSDFKIHGGAQEQFCMYNCEKTINDYRYIKWDTKTKFRTFHSAFLCKKSKDFIKKALTDKSIVITHHAPSIKSCQPEFKYDITCSAFISNLEPVIKTYKPLLWVHGHTHYNVDYQLESTRVISNQRNYPAFPDKTFNPDLIVEI